VSTHFKNEVLYKAISINEVSKGYIYKNNNKEEIMLVPTPNLNAKNNNLERSKA